MTWMFTPRSGHGASSGSKSIMVARREWLSARAAPTGTMKGLSSTRRPYRRSGRQQLARIHHAGRVQLRLERAQRVQARVAVLGRHPRHVVGADGVVVGDRPAGADDRRARVALGGAPLLDLLAGPGAVQEREVQRRPGRVEVRDVATDELRVAGQRAADRAAEDAHVRPRRRGLERLDQQAAVHDVVAQVGPVEARALPRLPELLAELRAATGPQALVGGGA